MTFEDYKLRISNVWDWVNTEHNEWPHDSWRNAAERVAQKHDRAFLDYVDSLDLTLEEKTRIIDFSTDALAIAKVQIDCLLKDKRQNKSFLFKAFSSK